MIAETARIYPGVELGEGAHVEDYCIIGVPPTTGEEDLGLTVIGAGAVIRAFTVIYAGNRIGDRFQTGNKTNVRELNIIGDDVSIGSHSVVEHHVEIGNGVRIHSQAFVPEFTLIEDEAWIGPSVVLTNARYPRSPTVKDELAGPRIRRRAMIGANSTVLPGVEIGEGSLVGAASVVTKDVPPGVIVTGAPARVVRNIHY